MDVYRCHEFAMNLAILKKSAVIFPLFDRDFRKV